MGVIAVTTTARPLDRRRDKAGAADAAATRAEAAVSDIDHQLETIAHLTEQQRQALHRAAEERDRLKRSLKAAAKRRAELAKERKKAVAKAARARTRAKAAESKYDREVLADLVRREKEKDRAGSTAARAPRRSAAADPPPEQPDEGTQTARRTAARKTAKAARLIR
ncbi:hypothetical protein GCM10020358_79480 [Amorphoplanes nipponensis]|uniref:Uncharacterized protein n=1 Tax=Actinoplanes nipponensis TaxID=135950 RepID=A0A919JPB7_9ACTN|nr:hypothetical protein Ani05nite_79970 [Actinoplanes nipponensis]